MRSITLTQQTQASAEDASSYALTISVDTAVNVPKEIFVMQRYKKYDGTLTDDFVGVCSPSLLEDLPTVCPVADSSFYRVAQIQIVSTSQLFLNWTIKEVAGDAQQLCQDLEAMDALGVTQTITVSS